MIDPDYDPGVETGQPLDVIAHCLKLFGAQIDHIGEDEISATLAGSWTRYELRAMWRANDRVVQFLAFPDIRVTADQQAAVDTTTGLANEQLWIGHFELWHNAGLVVYRHAVLLDPAQEHQFSLDQAETVIETAIEECERFYPVFQFVLWGGKSPQEAIAASMIETAGEA